MPKRTILLIGCVLLCTSCASPTEPTICQMRVDSLYVVNGIPVPSFTTTVCQPIKGR